MKKKYQITEDKRRELKTELEVLKAGRAEIAEKIAAARDLGDLSENADYDAARDEQGQAESRIAEIDDILQNAETIAKKKSDKVVIGSIVDLKNGGKSVSYQIVGPVEADPIEGKISNESPIGQALLGKKVGDHAEIKTPKGITKYAIQKIS